MNLDGLSLALARIFARLASCGDSRAVYTGAMSGKLEPQGSRESRVYLAEALMYAIYPPTPFSDTGQAKEFLDDVQSRRWFVERWPRVYKKDITIKKARTYKYSSTVAWENKMFLTQFHMNQYVVLHELSHVIADKESYYVDQHGPQFCGVYMYLLKRVVGPEVERCLRNAFKSCGVAYEGVG